MLGLFIYFGSKEYTIKTPDNVKFSNEYKDISKNNIFSYVSAEQVKEILNKKSGILFMGFASNVWSHYYANYLNEVAISNGIKNIYYYDFQKDRNLNNQLYNDIVTYLEDYLNISDTNGKDLFAPTIVIVKNGEVIYFDDEIHLIKGNITPEEYFTDYKKNLFLANLDNAIKKYIGEAE